MDDYSSGNQAMPNLMAALQSLQGSNQFQQHQDLQKLLQYQQLQAEIAKQQAGFGHEKEMLPLKEQSEEKLAQFQTNEGLRKVSEESKQAKDLYDKLPKSEFGGKSGVKVGGADISGSQPNVYTMEHKENSDFRKDADKNTKDLKDQMDAAHQALSYLQQGNPFSDQMAVLPEIKAVLGSSKGVASVMQAFQNKFGSSPNETAGALLNRFNNTADPTMRQSLRNAMQESIIDRANNTQKRYQAVRKQYETRAGQLMNPQSAMSGTFGEADDLGSRTNELANKYYQEKSKTNQPQQSNPGAVSASNPTPSNWERLKGLLNPSAVSQPQQAPQQPTSDDPVAAEMKRRGLQ